ncbi:hypothetical protein THAOC_20206, partial [Thalassiosira oceanica]
MGDDAKWREGWEEEVGNAPKSLTRRWRVINITQRHMSLPPRPVPAPHDVRAKARARHAVPHRDVRERLGPDAAVHAPQGEADAVPRDERVNVRKQTG